MSNYGKYGKVFVSHYFIGFNSCYNLTIVAVLCKLVTVQKDLTPLNVPQFETIEESCKNRQCSALIIYDEFPTNQYGDGFIPDIPQVSICQGIVMSENVVALAQVAKRLRKIWSGVK